ncbi:MAG: PLP-dependent aminotransferase family protein [Caulobacter sp.]|nr:PLP-dependent aminotransferase family protein [Vitreoscilla sp.]
MPSLPSAIAPADALLDWLQHAWAHPSAEEARVPIGARLTQLLRRAILDRVVPPAHRLPSTRTLAQALAIARNTAVPVDVQLRAEGSVVAGQGSGTYVCRIGPDVLPAAAVVEPVARSRAATPLAFSRRGRRYHSHPLHEFWTRQPFCPGQFDFALFPHRLWNRLQQRQLRRADPIQLEQGEPGGAPELRQAIAEHVRATRGVRCAPDQVIITDGTGESIDLVARLMCDPGDEVLLEDPGYWAATQVLSDHGLRLHAAPVDAQGLPVPVLRRGQRAPRLAYLTPSNQFPTGGVMPLARRLEWLQFAARHDTLLLEDDYDSEYRYEGAPFPSLQGQDAAGRVIYLGTFSKTVYPGIRVAFLVVPPGLQRVFADASADFYRDGDQIVQQVLADFMREGHYAAHVRTLRREYASRREAMLRALDDALPEEFASRRLSVVSGARGVHLTLALPDDVDDRAVARAAIAHGVTAIPLSVYATQVGWRGLVLSFAATPVAHIGPLVDALAPVLRDALAPGR